MTIDNNQSRGWLAVGLSGCPGAVAVSHQNDGLRQTDEQLGPADGAKTIFTWCDATF